LARFFAFFMIFLIRYGSAKRRSGRYL
jgi:hypothetical protein